MDAVNLFWTISIGPHHGTSIVLPRHLYKLSITIYMYMLYLSFYGFFPDEADSREWGEGRTLHQVDFSWMAPVPRDRTHTFVDLSG